MPARVDPDAVQAARARLAAMQPGDAAQAAATRRTAGRRAPEHDTADQPDIAALPDDIVLTAGDPARLERLALLAAAIHLAGDLAAVIDRAGRAQIEDVLGAELRRLAVSARKHAGPRRMLSGPALMQALEQDRDTAKCLWLDMLPAELRPADAGRMGHITDAKRDALCAALRQAEALLAAPAECPEPDKDLAA